MTHVQAGIKSGGRWRRVLWGCALLAFAAKVWIASDTYGSTDALLWQSNLEQLRSEGALALYSNGTTLKDAGVVYHREVFNHPPFMLHLLAAWDGLSAWTGLPLRFWMRLTCAASDLAALALLAGMVARRKLTVSRGSMLLAAASPVSLMISGFHGNTDPIMTALLVLSVWLLETAPAWLAGAALGMAVNIKIVPLLLAPAFFFYLRGRARAELVAGAVLTVLIGSMPWLLQDPWLIVRQVAGYHPQSGMWGLSVPVLGLATEQGFRLYVSLAKTALAVLMLAAAVWMNRGGRRAAPLLQCGFLGFLALAGMAGFGVQYLSWVVPWSAQLRWRQALAFHVTAGIFLFTYYTRAAGGFPWYLANSARTPVWDGSLVLLGLVCWVSVCASAIALGRRLRAIDSRAPRIEN